MNRRAPEPVSDAPPTSSTIFELAPDRFLVFRPRDYQHGPHAHSFRFRFRVIKGRIEIRMDDRVVIAHPHGRNVTLEPRKPHTTRALEDTWALVEREPR